jgi:catechol 2,3-dioxygenase-like lactoylglutathione lyase family enzyme
MRWPTGSIRAAGAATDKGMTTMAADYAITFFYYEDMKAVIPFYEETLGFELVLDQGMARIYRIAPGSYFGIVDGNKGHLRHQPSSAVLLTIVAEDVAGWHARLKAKGVPKQTEMLRGTYCEHFFFEDPAGYAIEVQRFHNPDVAKLFR